MRNPRWIAEPSRPARAVAHPKRAARAQPDPFDLVHRRTIGTCDSCDHIRRTRAGNRYCARDYPTPPDHACAAHQDWREIVRDRSCERFA